MITIKKLKFSNMFSYGENNEIILNNSNVLQLVGKNGAGKSSIPTILEELLYNKNSRGTKKADIKNRYTDANYYSGVVEFDVDDDEYKLEKVVKSSTKLTLTKNGEDISGHTPTQTYKKLETEILKLDFNTFSKLVYQSMNSSLDFLKATDSKRKEFLISLLSLDKYVTIHNRIKEVVKEAKDVLTGHKAVAASKESEIKSNRAIEVTYDAKEIPEVDETIRDEIANLKAIESQREKIQERTVRYNKALKTKESTELAYKSFKLPEVKPLPANNDRIKELFKEIHATQAEINSLAKSVRDLEAGVGTCSACGQELPDSDSKAQHLESLKAELLALRNKQTTIKSEHDTEIANAKKATSYQEQLDKQAQLLKKAEEAKEALENTEKPDALPDSVEDEITKLTAEYNRQTVAKQQAEQHNALRAKQIAKYEAQKELVAQAKEKLKHTQESIKEYESYLEDVKILESAFGPKGLVQYKIESNIKVFEALINEYLVLLSNGDFNIRFQIEDSKLRIVVFQHGEEIDINSASSGEFNNINTATLLAVRKMMTSISKVSINILFLDEVISVLDVESRENLIDILVKERNLNSVVVSHGFEHPLADTVSIVKEGKTSKCK